MGPLRYVIRNGAPKIILSPIFKNQKLCIFKRHQKWMYNYILINKFIQIYFYMGPILCGVTKYVFSSANFFFLLLYYSIFYFKENLLIRFLSKTYGYWFKGSIMLDLITILSHSSFEKIFLILVSLVQFFYVPQTMWLVYFI